MIPVLPVLEQFICIKEEELIRKDIGFGVIFSN
jgi:hypothetical protein